jgi:hypothetical protein
MYEIIQIDPSGNESIAFTGSEKECDNYIDSIDPEFFQIYTFIIYPIMPFIS